jgi:hypothetical protein
MAHSSYQKLIRSMHSIMSYFKTMAYCSRLCTYGTEVFKNYEIENKIYHIVRLIKKYHRRIVETKSIPLTHIFK